MSIISKVFTGYCPEQNKIHSIVIDYDGYDSLEGSGPYSKSRMDCDSDFCCPKRNSCPIYKDAPEKLR